MTSIILVTHNQLEYTRLCVESIRQHTPEPYELVFVDNGSTDGTVEWMKVIGERLSVIGEAGEVSGDRWAAGGDCECLWPSALRPLLSLCMIARDNEHTIAAALEGIRPWVDEMVVVDTGSTDRTPQIAVELGARVFHFPWRDDFSAARNESIHHALGQWIFWMDTDDVIDEDEEKGDGNLLCEAPSGPCRQKVPVPFFRRHLSSVDRGIKGYRARLNLAAIYTDMGDFAKAEQQWRRVIDELPKNLAAWRGLGDVLIRQRRYDDAVAVADQMQTNTALARDARLLRVEVLVARGDAAAAESELETGLREHSDNSVLVERRCRLLFEHFPPADAEPAFRALIARDSQNPSAYHNLGSILYKLGRYEESVEAYRASLRLRPHCASTYVHLGYALCEVGKRNEAIVAWEQALRLAPGDPAATQALHRAQNENGQRR